MHKERCSENSRKILFFIVNLNLLQVIKGANGLIEQNNCFLKFISVKFFERPPDIKFTIYIFLLFSLRILFTKINDFGGVIWDTDPAIMAAARSETPLFYRKL